MQDDRISIELRLPGVKVLEVKEEEHWIEVLAQGSGAGDVQLFGDFYEFVFGLGFEFSKVHGDSV